MTLALLLFAVVIGLTSALYVNWASKRALKRSDRCGGMTQMGSCLLPLDHEGRCSDA